MTGWAPASRILGGTLEGPGPNMCRCGATKGRSRHGGLGTHRGDVVDDMVAADCGLCD